jgi:beta-glucosidase
MGDVIRTQPTGIAIKTWLPLRCFSDAGAYLNAVGAPIVIRARTGFAATIRSIHLAAMLENAPCPNTNR